MFVRDSGLAEAGTFPTMTAVAPAAFAFVVFTTKVQVPRSMNAIFPVRLVVIAVQPSAGWTATMSPLRSKDCAPKTAVPVA